MLILYGPPGDASRSTWFRTFPDDPVSASETLWITPTQRKQQWVAEQFRSIFRRFPPRIHTFDGLTQLLYERLGGTAVLLSADAIGSVLESLLSAPHLSDILQSCMTHAPGPGFIAEITRQIDELQRHGMTWQTLEAVPDAQDGYGTLFSAIYQSCHRILDAHGKISIGGMQVHVSTLLDDGVPNTLPWKTCVFDGFLELTPLQLDIIRSLDTVMDVTLVWPGNPVPGGLFNWMSAGLINHFPEAVWHSLALKNAGSAPLADSVSDSSGQLSDAAFQLAGYAPDFLPSDVASGSRFNGLRIIERDTVRDEVTAIARDILCRVQSGDSTWKDIAVTCPNLQHYAPSIRRIFQRYGIPVNISQSLPLTGSPVFTSIQRLLKLANGWQHPDVLAVVSDSGLTGLHPAESRMLVRRLAEWSFEYKVVRSQQRWSGMLEKIIAERASDSPDLLPAQKALDIIRRLDTALSETPDTGSGSSTDRSTATATPSQWLAWLRTVLAKLQVNRNIEFLQRLVLQHSESGSQHFEYTRRAYNRLVEYFDAVEPFLVTVHDENAGSSRITMVHFADILERMMAGVDYQLTTRAGDRVQIPGLRGIPGLTFRHVYFAGLTDTMFPAHEPVSPFWDPDMISTILDKPPHAKKTGAFADLIRVMGASLESLTISRPLRNKDEDLLPSPVWDYLTALFPEYNSVTEPLKPLCLRDRLLTMTDTDIPDTVAAARTLTGRAIAGKRRSGGGIWCSDLTATTASTQQIIDSLYGVRRTFSPSALEQYLGCPRQFFFDRLLKLDEPETPADEMTALDRGALIHRVLCLFYRERLSSGSGRVLPHEIDSCAARIRHIATDVLADMEYTDNAVQRQVMDIVGCEELDDDGMALRFARLEAGGHPDLQPSLLEWSLASGTDRFVLKDTNGRNIAISGTIDRLDRYHDHAVIWDYKTGSLPAVKDIVSCTSIQIGLYMMAAEHLLKINVDAGGYYLLQNRCDPVIKTAVRPENTVIATYLPPEGRSNSLDREWPENEYRDYRERLKQTIAEAVGRIRRGSFEAAQTDTPCRYCAYTGLCRRMKEIQDVDV